MKRLSERQSVVRLPVNVTARYTVFRRGGAKTLKATATAIAITSCSLLVGCGLVFQGRTATVLVDSAPAGATVTIAGEAHTTPASLTLPRKRGGVVIRASKTGYAQACRVIDLSTTRGLVAL